MGLFGLVVDAAILSTAAAGLRRTTGFSVHQKMHGFVRNPTLQTATNAYFKIGEFIVDKGVEFLSKSAESTTQKNPTK